MPRAGPTSRYKDFCHESQVVKHGRGGHTFRPNPCITHTAIISGSECDRKRFPFARSEITSANCRTRELFLSVLPYRRGRYVTCYGIVATCPVQLRS
jgi:hypothetical protein